MDSRILCEVKVKKNSADDSNTAVKQSMCKWQLKTSQATFVPIITIRSLNEAESKIKSRAMTTNKMIQSSNPSKLTSNLLIAERGNNSCDPNPSKNSKKTFGMFKSPTVSGQRNAQVYAIFQYILMCNSKYLI